MYVRCEADELEGWKEMAAVDGKLLSEWVRDVLNGYDGAEPRKAVARIGRKLSTPPAEMQAAPTKKLKTCGHGTKKGYHCWQCGGLAQA